jgi:hypothetical protein
MYSVVGCLIRVFLTDMASSGYDLASLGG